MYKIYNGTAWVDVCDCIVKILNHNNIWREINPYNCDIKYWTGSQWCDIICITDIGEEAGSGPA
jgi:hypothetical protein